MVHLKYQNFKFFCDSWIVNQKMRNIQSGKDVVVGRVQKRILALNNDVSKIHFFHIKLQNNVEANMEVNKGFMFIQGNLLINRHIVCKKWATCFHL